MVEVVDVIDAGCLVSLQLDKSNDRYLNFCLRLSVVPAAAAEAILTVYVDNIPRLLVNSITHTHAPLQPGDGAVNIDRR